jgi:hypothetical protein
VWGVEPEGADAMTRSLQAGRAVHLDRVERDPRGPADPAGADQAPGGARRRGGPGRASRRPHSAT